MRRLIVILGIPIDDLDINETLDRLEEMALAGRELGRGHQVATVNADFVVKALRDPNLRKILQWSDLATADGMPLVWGARLLGVPLRGRVAGADIVPKLAERAAQKGFSLYLLGAAPGVAARAAEVLQSNYPELKIVGIQSPTLPSIEDTDPALLDSIRAAKPDFLLVAFGNPKQEKWIARFGPKLNIPVMMGVGGSLDFVAGKTHRAPLWMQRSGLEWVYRLIQEPRRLWQRYAVDLFVFSSFFLRQLWAMRHGWLPSKASLAVLPANDDLLLIEGIAILNIHRQLTAAGCEAFRAMSGKALEVTPWIVANLEATEFLDSSAIGALVSLSRQAHEAGGELWLAGLRPNVMETLRMLRLDSFFAFLPNVSAGLDSHNSVQRPAVIPSPGLSRT